MCVTMGVWRWCGVGCVLCASVLSVGVVDMEYELWEGCVSCVLRLSACSW